MPSRKDCLDDLAKRTGKKREEVEDLLNEIDDKAEDYRERYGMDRGEAYRRARDEKLYEISEQAALRRRAEILDTKKETERRRYYADTAMRIAKLPGVSEAFAKKLAVRAARLAMEAKLVGVNLPFFKGRMSVDAQYVALRRLWVGGFSRDLEEAGLLKIFASRQIEDKWIDELFELNRSTGGNPGVTKDKQALAIAEKELAGAQEHYKLITLQYKAGAITFLEVTNSQSVLTEAENASVLARIDRVSAAYDYLAAIGALDLAKTK